MEKLVQLTSTNFKELKMLLPPKDLEEKIGRNAIAEQIPDRSNKLYSQNKIFKGE